MQNRRMFSFVKPPFTGSSRVTVTMAMFLCRRLRVSSFPSLRAFSLRNLNHIFWSYLSARKWMRRQRQLNSIVVVGDSHVNFFSGNENISFTPFYYRSIKDNFKTKIYINTCSDKLDHFSTLHLGPCLAYSVCRDKSSTLTKEKLLFLFEKEIIPRGARVLFSFGEIDIRVHVIKQAIKQQKSVSEICEEIISGFLNQLLEFRSKYDIKVYCWAPPPSQNESLSFNKEFPTYGTEIERNKVTLIFEEILAEKCEEFSFTFLSITKMLIDEEYRTKKNFISDDSCHLSQKAWGNEMAPLAYMELKKKGLLK